MPLSPFHEYLSVLTARDLWRRVHRWPGRGPRPSTSRNRKYSAKTTQILRNQLYDFCETLRQSGCVAFLARSRFSLEPEFFEFRVTEWAEEENWMMKGCQIYGGNRQRGRRATLHWKNIFPEAWQYVNLYIRDSTITIILVFVPSWNGLFYHRIHQAERTL